MSAEQVRAALNIRPQTLYAYVSRGWIRSIKQAGRRKRLYLLEDVERVSARSRARAGHGAVAASAMNWGDPIIPTSITDITPEGPSYRGHLATQLVGAHARFETVAELLWTGLWHDRPQPWPAAVPSATSMLPSALNPPHSRVQILEVFASAVLSLGTSRGSIEERVRGGKTIEAAQQIVKTLASCLGFAGRRGSFRPMRKNEFIVEGILASLDAPATDENVEALEAMLVLFADHELSPPTFAARIAASTGATIHGCVVSAICASAGVRFARVYDPVADFLANGSSRKALMTRARKLQERGNTVPGFGHPLYPHGDPRARLLLDIAQRRKRQTPRLEAIYRFAQDIEREFGVHPRHELAAIALSIAMELPEHCAGALFILGRTAGWIAHVQEQRLSNALLRPRAKFLGRPAPLPDERGGAYAPAAEAGD